MIISALVPYIFLVILVHIMYNCKVFEVNIKYSKFQKVVFITSEAKNQNSLSDHDADIALDGKITALTNTEFTHFPYLDNKTALETTRATADVI